MDLIYANSKGEDIGVLKDYTFDLAFGTDENDFELTMDVSNHCCEPNGFIYIEGTEYGGIIDKMGVVTVDDKLLYMGRTWHGILNSKVIEPNADGTPFTISGEANAVIKVILERIGLTDLFIVPDEDSGVAIVNYTFGKYINAYFGLANMVASGSGKLKFVFLDGKVTISAIPAVDYSQDEQFDSDQVEMDIEKIFNSMNHLICVGKEDAKEQLPTVHLYRDTDGIFKQTDKPTVTGLQDITDIYEYSSQDDLNELLEELTSGNIEKLQKYLPTDTVRMDFAAEETIYDVGDIIGAKEVTTGIFATEKITKKIVTISQGSVNINYKVGE